MRPLSFDADVTAVVMGQWVGVPVAIVGTADSLLILDATGEELSRTAMRVSDLLLVDLDGNGTTEFVVCGADGIHLVRGSAEHVGKPIEIAKEPCEAIVPYVPDGPYAAVVSAAAGKITIWAPHGNIVKPVPWDGEYTGRPVLASTADAFALASIGSSGIQEESKPGRSTFATLDSVEALVAGPAGWTWLAGSEQPTVVNLRREATPVAPTARGLVVGNLAGRGESVVVLHPEGRAIGILSGGRERLITVPTQPHRGVITDLNGDACAEVMLLDTRSGVLLDGVCGGGASHQVAVAPAPTPVPAPVAGPDPVVAPDPVPAAAPDPEPVAEPIGDLPAELSVGTVYANLRVGVGQRVDIQLMTPKNNARRWNFRGGPQGLEVSGDGWLTFVPKRQHIGLWSVSLRIREGAVSRWSGINITVVDAAPEP